MRIEREPVALRWSDRRSTASPNRRDRPPVQSPGDGHQVRRDVVLKRRDDSDVLAGLDRLSLITTAHRWIRSCTHTTQPSGKLPVTGATDMERPLKRSWTRADIQTWRREICRLETAVQTRTCDSAGCGETAVFRCAEGTSAASGTRCGWSEGARGNACRAWTAERRVGRRRAVHVDSAAGAETENAVSATAGRQLSS